MYFNIIVFTIDLIIFSTHCNIWYNQLLTQKHHFFFRTFPYTHDSGPSMCGTVQIAGIYLPYVNNNGYKYVMVRDTNVLFTDCHHRCPIPRQVISKTSELMPAMCSFEEVSSNLHVHRHPKLPMLSAISPNVSFC